MGKTRLTDAEKKQRHRDYDARTKINLNSNLLGRWEMVKDATGVPDNLSLIRKLLIYYIEHQYCDAPSAPPPAFTHGSKITEPHRDYFKGHEIDMISALLTNFQVLLKQLDYVTASTIGKHDGYEPNTIHASSSIEDCSATVAEFSDKLHSFYEDIINVQIQVEELGQLRAVIVGNIVGSAKKTMNKTDGNGNKAGYRPHDNNTISSTVVRNTESTIVVNSAQSELVTLRRYRPLIQSSRQYNVNNNLSENSYNTRSHVFMEPQPTIASALATLTSNKIRINEREAKLKMKSDSHSNKTFELSIKNDFNDNPIYSVQKDICGVDTDGNEMKCKTEVTNDLRDSDSVLCHDDNDQNYRDTLVKIEPSSCTKSINTNNDEFIRSIPHSSKEKRQTDRNVNYKQNCNRGIIDNQNPRYVDDSLKEISSDAVMYVVVEKHVSDEVDAGIAKQGRVENDEESEESEYSDYIEYSDNVDEDPDYVDKHEHRVISAIDADDPDDNDADGDSGANDDCDADDEHDSNKESSVTPVQPRQKTPPGPFQCQQCNYQFMKKWHLTKHMNLSHRQLHNNSTQCHECGMTFAQKRTLKNHLMTHSAPLKCDVCGKIFVQKEGLLKHGLIHSDTRNFLCVHCGKAFRESSTLNKHIKCKHNQGDTEKEVCGTCNKAVSRWCLNRHMREVHENLRPFICEICQKAFANKTNLRVHLASHERGTL